MAQRVCTGPTFKPSGLPAAMGRKRLAVAQGCAAAKAVLGSSTAVVWRSSQPAVQMDRMIRLPRQQPGRMLVCIPSRGYRNIQSGCKSLPRTLPLLLATTSHPVAPDAIALRPTNTSSLLSILDPPMSFNTQKALAAIADAASANKFGYNKFVAIGLFRLLELTGAKEPAALERLVKSVNVKQDAVNKDLMMYKVRHSTALIARAPERARAGRWGRRPCCCCKPL